MLENFVNIGKNYALLVCCLLLFIRASALHYDDFEASDPQALEHKACVVCPKPQIQPKPNIEQISANPVHKPKSLDLTP